MMTHQRKNRIVAMLLTAVMIIGMVPTITHAAEEPKVESFMKLERAFDFDLVSALCNSEESGNYQNYYTSAVTRGGLSGNPLEWTLLSYAMDKGQYVDLELWRLAEPYQSSSENPIRLEPDLTNGEALEDFLRDADHIGYLNGYSLRDHVIEVDETHFEQKEDFLSEDLLLACMDAVRQEVSDDGLVPERERVTMFQQYAIGHDGQPMEGIQAPQQIRPASLDPDFMVEPPTFDMWGDQIINYFLWDGRVCTEDGTELDVDFTTGRYIISMTPNDERTKMYNRFVAFVYDGERISEELTREEFETLYKYRTEDPVDLLSGSFLWDYTDTALYGEHDLEYTRSYSSSRAGSDIGLGNGWADNYHTSLERFGASAAISCLVEPRSILS